MDSTETIVSADTPRGGIALRERPAPDGSGLVHELVVAGVVAADTFDSSVEVAIAQEALARTSSPGRVLVDGLGLGLTTWQVLKDKRVQHVDVVELESDLLEWARLGLAPTMGLVARHPRVDVHAGDITPVLRGDATPLGPWDLVLLAGGPGARADDSDNDRDVAGALRVALDQVSPGGTLAIWVPEREPELLQTLEQLAPTEEVLLDGSGHRPTRALYLTRA